MKEKHILIIDDDVDFVNLMTALLQANDYKVDSAHQGTEGIKKVHGRPDLILLDLNLPDMEGLEVCRRIRDDKRLRRIPIIMLTARDTSADKIEGLYIGADDYITKPFESEELLARIEASIRRSRFIEEDQEDKELMLQELKRILKHGLITPFFQPIFSVEDLKPLGFEVLSRPPLNTILSNPEFLFRAAVKFGLYSKLESMCWQKALKTWNYSQNLGKLFLNCTPYLIESSQFTEDFLLEMKIDPSRVVLEITERMSIGDYSSFLKKLKNIKDLGVQIAVDDVGSGFASLNMVAELKPNFVKIDMPLIRQIHVDPLKQNMVESLVDFCRKSGIHTIAEGIEAEEELEMVSSLGVNALQGYLLSHPNKEIRTGSYLRK